MWTKNKSLMASIIMVILLFFIIIGAAITLPKLLFLYAKMTGRAYYGGLVAALYISVPPALICDVSLFRLLIKIKKGEIFVTGNVTILRILSWCCFFVGMCFVICGYKYISMLLLSFAAFFFALILRVIKNVFDKAIALREENDYTI